MNERRLYHFCPICDIRLWVESLGPFGLSKCPDCDYEFRGQGSYASLVTLRGKKYHLDDMFDDSEKLQAKIDEIRSSNA